MLGMLPPTSAYDRHFEVPAPYAPSPPSLALYARQGQLNLRARATLTTPHRTPSPSTEAAHFSLLLAAAPPRRADARRQAPRRMREASHDARRVYAFAPPLRHLPYYATCSVLSRQEACRELTARMAYRRHARKLLLQACQPSRHAQSTQY